MSLIKPYKLNKGDTVAAADFFGARRRLHRF